MTETLGKTHSGLRPNRPYEFVPASTDTCIKGFNLGVRYERNKKYDIERQGNGFIIRLVDRSLYLMRSFELSKNRLFGADFDEVISLDILLNKDVLGQMGYTFSMVNAAEISTKYTFDDYDAECTPMWPRVIADSGGFQLNSGAADFLDPHEVIEKHNRVCDIGIILDIPLLHAYQKQLLLRAAKIQKANTKILMAGKRDSLELMNVIHGSTFYLRRKFREAVENDKINRVALGGVKTLDLVPLVMHIMMLVNEGRKYDHYHVLGVSGLERWVALSYIARKNIAKLITSDSSSYIQSGINLQYFDPMRLLGIHDFRSDGDAFTRKHLTLPCSCAVCSAVRYSIAISDKKNTLGFTIITGHNLMVSRSYIDEIWALSAESKSTILNFLKPMFSAGKLDTINKALCAIDEAMDSGVDKAAAKYAPHLLEKFPRGERVGLFTKEGATPDTAVFKRFDRVLKGYEKFHNIGEE